jgi:hypothetical protein
LAEWLSQPIRFAPVWTDICQRFLKNLRDCQVSALLALKNPSLEQTSGLGAHGHWRGKTFTAITSAYRLLHSAGPSESCSG